MAETLDLPLPVTVFGVCVESWPVPQPDDAAAAA
jgi:hypothetical protein